MFHRERNEAIVVKDSAKKELDLFDSINLHFEVRYSQRFRQKLAINCISNWYDSLVKIC
jgi:hypothetical protein